MFPDCHSIASAFFQCLIPGCRSADPLQLKPAYFRKYAVSELLILLFFLSCFSPSFRPCRSSGRQHMLRMCMRRFRAGENGKGSQDVCSRPAAKTSGVKNIVSTIFFTLMFCIIASRPAPEGAFFAQQYSVFTRYPGLSLCRKKPGERKNPHVSFPSPGHAGILCVIYRTEYHLRSYSRVLILLLKRIRRRNGTEQPVPGSR